MDGDEGERQSANVGTGPDIWPLITSLHAVTECSVPTGVDAARMDRDLKPVTAAIILNNNNRKNNTGVGGGGRHEYPLKEVVHGSGKLTKSEKPPTTTTTKTTAITIFSTPTKRGKRKKFTTENDKTFTTSTSTGSDSGKSSGADTKKQHTYHSMAHGGVEMQRLNDTTDRSVSPGPGARLLSFFIGGRTEPSVRPPSENRIVYVCGRHKRYADNMISTAKYNLLTFFPKFLFEQFRKYANIFFLFIALMQQIPNVSPTGRYTTLVPFIVIMCVSAIKEFFEDIKRHRADSQINHNIAYLFDHLNGTLVEKRWQDLKVGNLVMIKKDQFFPSDLLLLTSSEQNGVCFIETANLDGETNLKSRSGLAQTDQMCCKNVQGKKELDLNTIAQCELMHAEIVCDLPNVELYEFVGKIKIGHHEYPLSADNILLRGAKLKNTDWVFGCIIYAGHETKLMMNSRTANQATIKQSYVEIMTNRQIVAMLGVLLVICFISAMFSMMWVHQNPDHWYLAGLDDKLSRNFFLIFLTFIILYNNLIPISLQVTLEMVRVIQAHFINNDLEMYCAETDTPAMARTSNLNEELGRVRYILSDKTGTMTRNVMEFKKCSINGTIFDDSNFPKLSEMILQNKKHSETIREFLTLLAVCHTVIPEPQKNDRLIYHGSSPDEAALVKGAQMIGFEFRQRTPKEVIIDAMGKVERYELLYVLPFNSDRKRMSTIVRAPSGEIKIYTKGADSIIEQRLSKKSREKFEETETNLTTFSTNGLRTLCCAYRIIPKEEFTDWEKRYQAAQLMPTVNAQDRKKREDTINDLMSEIEKNLVLLGATAIEDKLQEGVPETIETLMRAGISIWMLTGDKLETATNIAYSCRLLKNIQNLDSYHIIKGNTLDETRESLMQAANKLKAHSEDFTLVIDNKSLNHCLQANSDLRQMFVELALACRSVICCRVSPGQKAEVVAAVKTSTDAITLAIGDGANDVAMIKAAHVGVGISGCEGLQAVYSSDYAIAQFRFLTRLLLVHGAWSFSRVCKLILYSFYKNIALYVIELWFATVSAWSGQAVFERWTIGLYNVIFTFAPPLAMGLFDRVCSAELMLKNPELYRDQTNIFSIKIFWFWIFSAIWHSLVLFWMTYMAVNHDALWMSGKSDGGYLCFGNILYTYVVVTVCLKAALEMNCWTLPTHFCIWGSIVSWFVFLVIYCRLWPSLPMGADISNMDKIIFSTGVFWLGLAVIPFSALLVDIVIKLVTRTCFKSLADRIIELEALKNQPPTPISINERARLLVHSILPSTAAPTGRTSRRTSLTPPPSSASHHHHHPPCTTADHKPADHTRGKRLHSDASESERDALHGYSFSHEEKSGGSQISEDKLVFIYNTKDPKSDGQTAAAAASGAPGSSHHHHHHHHHHRQHQNHPQQQLQRQQRPPPSPLVPQSHHGEHSTRPITRQPANPRV